MFLAPHETRASQTTLNALFRRRVHAGNRCLIVHGAARITDGGAAQTLQEFAHVYLGPDMKFPPGEDPPPGRIVHITVERIAGVGPWATAD